MNGGAHNENDPPLARAVPPAADANDRHLSQTSSFRRSFLRLFKRGSAADHHNAEGEANGSSDVDGDNNDARPPPPPGLGGGPTPSTRSAPDLTTSAAATGMRTSPMRAATLARAASMRHVPVDSPEHLVLQHGGRSSSSSMDPPPPSAAVGAVAGEHPPPTGHHGHHDHTGEDDLGAMAPHLAGNPLMAMLMMGHASPSSSSAARPSSPRPPPPPSPRRPTSSSSSTSASLAAAHAVSLPALPTGYLGPSSPGSATTTTTGSRGSASNPPPPPLSTSSTSHLRRSDATGAAPMSASSPALGGALNVFRTSSSASWSSSHARAASSSSKSIKLPAPPPGSNLASTASSTAPAIPVSSALAARLPAHFLSSRSSFSPSSVRAIVPCTVGPEHFVKIKLLGKGDVGKVYLVRRKGGNKLYAMKVLSKSEMIKRNKVSRVLTEHEILTRSNHPFLISLYHSFQTPRNLYYCLEYCLGGEFFRALQRRPGRCLAEAEARFYVAEVLLALEYLHLQGYIYRDLKPENILLHASGHVKLADFDLSKRAELPDAALRPELIAANAAGVDGTPDTDAYVRGYRTNSFVGTEEYIAPEVIKGEGHSAAVDWWCLGILMYELLYGRTPFRSNSRNNTFKAVIRRDLQFPVTANTAVSNSARGLMRRLLTKDETRRIGSRFGAQEIKDHAWFKTVPWPLLRNLPAPMVPPVDKWDATREILADEDKCKGERAAEEAAAAEKAAGGGGGRVRVRVRSGTGIDESGDMSAHDGTTTSLATYLRASGGSGDRKSGGGSGTAMVREIASEDSRSASNDGRPYEPEVFDPSEIGLAPAKPKAAGKDIPRTGPRISKSAPRRVAPVRRSMSSAATGARRSSTALPRPPPPPGGRSSAATGASGGGGPNGPRRARPAAQENRLARFGSWMAQVRGATAAAAAAAAAANEEEDEESDAAAVAAGAPPTQPSTTAGAAAAASQEIQVTEPNGTKRSQASSSGRPTTISSSSSAAAAAVVAHGGATAARQRKVSAPVDPFATFTSLTLLHGTDDLLDEEVPESVARRKMGDGW
ncbi:hypothetical protein BC828DRAFT_390533 [Blastocladiella britannica]|nr:hypothetical protein BC828DRAFT_390533 [Blastocladiella britannica]